MGTNLERFLGKNRRWFQQLLLFFNFNCHIILSDAEHLERWDTPHPLPFGWLLDFNFVGYFSKPGIISLGWKFYNILDIKGRKITVCIGKWKENYKTFHVRVDHYDHQRDTFVKLLLISTFYYFSFFPTAQRLGDVTPSLPPFGRPLRIKDL